MLSDHACVRPYFVETMEMGYRDADWLPLPGFLYNLVDPGSICGSSFPTEDSMVLEGMEHSEETDHCKCCYVYSSWVATWKKERMARRVCCRLDQCSG